MNFLEIAYRVVPGIDVEIEQRRCPDQYVGQISAIEAARNLNLRCSPASRHPSERRLLLILESPHVSEYMGEPGPAKGITGKNIVMYLRLVNGLSSFAEHGLVLINAVQFQCSLGLPTHMARDRVFREVWRDGGRADFISRLRALYLAGDTIVNCCTKGRPTNTDPELRRLVQAAITEALPNAQAFRRNHPCSWHFARNRDRDWDCSPTPPGTRATG